MVQKENPSKNKLDSVAEINSHCHRVYLNNARSSLCLLLFLKLRGLLCN